MFNFLISYRLFYPFYKAGHLLRKYIEDLSLDIRGFNPRHMGTWAHIGSYRAHICPYGSTWDPNGRIWAHVGPNTSIWTPYGLLDDRHWRILGHFGPGPKMVARRPALEYFEPRAHMGRCKPRICTFVISVYMFLSSTVQYH